ncbi:cation efflux protein [Trichodelitschia bisporula]|uniref:Cation efflux protein n=1 Tax=Trichodelitschia bisporula TaxID=703511 RepID=A0A6G1I8K0_9PEZI|nr:cation efflux protein [Trichodelitschia bisporula]
MVGKRTLTDPRISGGYVDGNGDYLPGPTKPTKTPEPRPRTSRFTDEADRAQEDERREELKSRLLEDVERTQFERFRKHPTEIKAIKDKKIRQFYEAQNETLDDWLEVDTIVTSVADDIFESFDPDQDHDGVAERPGALQNLGEDVEAFLPEVERKSRRKAKHRARWAININVVANILLLAVKVGAVFYSSSLSLIASMVDSALDLLCTIIIWTTNKLAEWRISYLQRRFPVGRRRLEPLGILVFSVIMIVSFAQILQESVQTLLPSGKHVTAALSKVGIFGMASTIVVKGIIWFACMPIKTTQVQALAQDCKTDVFFNTFSLAFPAIGLKLDIWWLDPLGALLLSLFIIWDWGGTAFDNVTRLSGLAVDLRLLRKIHFLVYRFAPVVTGFKSIKAYHAGDGVWVEVDILLPPYHPLIQAHDIAETLQYCLEGLGEVDRAFVTVDYASEGPSGHSTAHI